MTPRGDAVLSVHVVGTPKQQGSKRSFVVPRKGADPAAGRKAFRGVVVDDNKKPLKDWRTDVVLGAQRAMSDAGGTWPVLGPLAVRLVLAMPRPSSAPKTRRTWPAVKPDVDKLARALLDALTDAGVWKDDAQVVDLHVLKDYPGPDVGQHVPGVRITVTRVGDPAGPTLPIERTPQAP